jgi:phosphocarrier protein
MKISKVVVPWREGLHLRHAARLVHLAKYFSSTISLRCGTEIADLRSIVSIISLCATVGTALDVVVWGDDEAEAAQAVERAFSAHGHMVMAGHPAQQ